MRLLMRYHKVSRSRYWPEESVGTSGKVLGMVFWLVKNRVTMAVWNWENSWEVYGGGTFSLEFPRDGETWEKIRETEGFGDQGLSNYLERSHSSSQRSTFSRLQLTASDRSFSKFCRIRASFLPLNSAATTPLCNLICAASSKSYGNLQREAMGWHFHFLVEILCWCSQS